MESQIRFAVIGCGHIGRRHSLRIEAEPRARLVAQCDVRPRREVLAEEAHAGVPYFRSPLELLASGIAFDIACICVPNGLHACVARMVLEHGRHVLIEKPIVLTAEDGEMLREIAHAHGARIYGVLQNRYSPSSRWLKELVTSGALGQIYHVQLQCLWNRDECYYLPRHWHGDAQLDGGTLYTQYSHFLDLLLWTMGEAEVLDAHFSNYAHADLIDFEDSGDIRLCFASGAHGHIFYSTAVHGRNMGVTLTILAEHGAVRLAGGYLERVDHAVVGGVEALPNLGAGPEPNQYEGYSGSAQNHHHVIANVVADLLGEPADTTGLDESLAVVRLINTIYTYR